MADGNDLDFKPESSDGVNAADAAVAPLVAAASPEPLPAPSESPASAGAPAPAPSKSGDSQAKPAAAPPAASVWDDSFAVEPGPDSERVDRFRTKLADKRASTSSLDPCPDCETLLEPWQVICHNCNKPMSSVRMPSVKEDTQEAAANLESAFQDWLKKGKLAFKEERYGEALACFREALVRSRILPNNRVREIEVRRELARALEKSEKNREASEQYLALSQLNRRTDQTDEFTKRAKALSLSTMDILSAVDKHASFRPPTQKEIKLVPLYCADCKRLLLEAEIYALRKGKMNNVRCFCGFEGVPMVRSDAKHLRALKTATGVRQRKAQMIQVASEPFFEGRQKRTACLLAIVLGTLGVHKFYLGEKVPGLAYLAFCWTGLPTVISLFEAINYSQMSRVTFNLMYNIEQVLLKLPPEEEEALGPDHADVFSMEISEAESDDFVDQYCTQES